MIFPLLLSFIVLSSGIHQGDWNYWNYEFLSVFGPYFWHKYFRNCGGAMQSPVNIDCKSAQQTNLECFVFEGYSEELGSATILNDDGKTIEVIPEKTLRLSGGGLSSKYELEEFHFHWGRYDDEGSEHTIDSERFSMEVHLVHRNEKYATTEEALQYKDGLLVLAVLYELCNNPSPIIETVTTNLDKVLFANQEASITFDSSLANLLPESNCKYFRYNGSLTTPECQEAVIWIVFADPKCVTTSELAKFREVRRTAPGEKQKFLNQNFRPIQPLNGRIIQTNENC